MLRSRYALVLSAVVLLALPNITTASSTQDDLLAMSPIEHAILLG
jgi:hypothetical protein